MKLVIHAHALKNESLSQAITGHFDERGGTIGRSDTNTLTLPDPERHVSRLQAEVLFAGRAFSIRNVGSANPIELNGRTLRPGEGAPLVPGDQLVIGGYAMRVVAEKTAAGAAAPAPRVDSRTVIRGSAGEARTDPPPRVAATPPHVPKRAAERVQPSVSDPFADLVSGPATAPAADSFGDPFADLLAGPAAPAPSAPVTLPPARPRHDTGFDDLLGLPGSSNGSGAGAGGSGLDSLFGLGGVAGGKDGAALLDDFLAPPKPAAGGVAGDLLDLFGDRPAASPGPKAAAFNHTPELEAAYAPPTVKVPPPPIAKKSPVAAAPPATLITPPAPVVKPKPAPSQPGDLPAGPASPDALWRAFCEGAGLNMPLQQGLNPQMMRVMGQLMHHAVEGALKLVASRAAAKQELRAQVTTIQSKNNNPLKFSVDPQQALAQLLQPPMRGFMPGPDAVRDAMDDLLGHQIGTMAGTRAALQGMFKRFEPALLEAKLTNKGVIDAVLPMNRRAKLWELYVEHYQQVQDEAQDDFHELFGKAFVKAYEQQLDRLEASRRKAG